MQEEEKNKPFIVSKKRRIIRWLTTLVLIYGFIGFTLYYFQERFLFHPEPLSAEYTYTFDAPFKEVNIAINSRDTLHMVQVFPRDTPVKKGIVIYFHGNRDNIKWYATFATTFTDRGYEVWMPEYPGFGKSSGKITEQLIYT